MFCKERSLVSWILVPVVTFCVKVMKSNFAVTSLNTVLLCSQVLTMCTFRQTSLTGAWPVASACAVTDESVPAFLADASVFARITLALLPLLLVAWGFDSSTILSLSNLTNVFASTINEKVTDAANIAIVEHCSPELSGQNEVGAVGGKPTQVHVPLQVQNFTFPACCKWSPSAVHRDCTWGGDEGKWYKK